MCCRRGRASAAMPGDVVGRSLRQYDSFHSRLDRRDHFREDHLRREAIVSPKDGLNDRAVLPAATAPKRRRACSKPAISVRLGTARARCASEYPGDAQWRSRGSKRCVTLSDTDTLSTELAGSTTPAAAILFVVSRLRMRWSELGGWSAEVPDTRLHPWDCRSCSWSPQGRIISDR
jgi:hypothetical protein